jgi:hypothetical protein
MNTSRYSEAWKRYHDSIMAIADDAVQRCTIPIDVASNETIQLSIVAKRDLGVNAKF